MHAAFDSIKHREELTTLLLDKHVDLTDITISDHLQEPLTQFKSLAQKHMDLLVSEVLEARATSVRRPRRAGPSRADLQSR